MSSTETRLADPDAVRDLLSGLPSALTERIVALSARLLGRPYQAFPLIGGPTTPEQLVTRVDRFDCVTFVETVVALATSASPEDFPRRLTNLRYWQGKVEWAHRNHYWSSWIKRNVRAHLVERVARNHWRADSPTPRALSVLRDYPTHPWKPLYLPAARVDVLELLGEPGDVLGFVSRRADLDTFHTGLSIPTPFGLYVRHAGRSAGEVVHQKLSEFLTANDVPGVLVVRPLEPRS
ncbi:MAG: N-acetylmuramoyl-L-alanine amidase-like domain-containing protein [Myxococcota bacterium]